MKNKKISKIKKNYKYDEKEFLSLVNEESETYNNIYFKDKDIYLIHGDCLKENLFNKEFIDWTNEAKTA